MTSFVFARLVEGPMGKLFWEGKETLTKNMQSKSSTRDLWREKRSSTRCL